jgi:hypothetical protein
MAMELKGRIVQSLGLQTGDGRKGTWKKQDYILETIAQYPKKVCFSVWGDKIDQFRLQAGDTVTVSFDLESREYNGRWYTDVRAWKVQKEGGSAPMDMPPAGDEPPFVADRSAAQDDLPF